MKFTFVVLNYNITKETYDCVESIKECTKNGDHTVSIIIVDNHSKDNIGEDIKEHYRDEESVTVILLDENLGFAKGNNVGIEHARQNGADYVVCLNNDVLIHQTDFCDIAEKKYEQYAPAVIGPKIITKNGTEDHRNGKLMSVQYYKNLREQFSQNNIPKVSGGIKGKIKNNKAIRYVYDHGIALHRKDRSKYFKETQNVILHGCCLIFTPKFFERLRGFHPGTFLFFEEELLYAMIVVENLSTLYTPDLQITHLEDISTGTIVHSNSEKAAFENEKKKDSLGVLIDYLETHEKQIYPDSEKG